MIENPQSRADFAANREEWATACESGRYVQGRGNLRSVANETCTYCVLGVGCDVSGLGEWETYFPSTYVYRLRSRNRAGCSGRVVGNWSEDGHAFLKLFGITFQQSVDLIIANDQGVSLSELAGIIRALPLPREVR